MEKKMKRSKEKKSKKKIMIWILGSLLAIFFSFSRYCLLYRPENNE